MRHLKRIRDGALSLLAVLGGIATIALMLHVTADVALRNTLNKPIPATYEIVTHYYMIALAFIPLAWVERTGAMVQVELIDPFMGPGLTRLSNRLVGLISLVVYAALFWVTAGTALKNFDTGTYVMAQTTRLATWPAYFILPLGFGLAMIVALIRLVSPHEEHGA